MQLDIPLNRLLCQVRLRFSALRLILAAELREPPPLLCSSSSSGCFQRTSRLWCRTPGWCPDAERRWGTRRQDVMTQSKAPNEHKEAAMPSRLSSLLVLLASCAHHGSSVVRCCDGLKPLLPRCVPAQSACVKIRRCFSLNHPQMQTEDVVLLGLRDNATTGYSSIK